jgi:hypothetical protein
MHCLNCGSTMHQIPDSNAEECNRCRQVQVRKDDDPGAPRAVLYFGSRYEAQRVMPDIFKQKSLFGG